MQKMYLLMYTLNHIYFRPKKYYGMGLSVCLSVCGYVLPLLQHLENHMSKGNKGNRLERKLEARETNHWGS
jgi:hypothetical protein